MRASKLLVIAATLATGVSFAQGFMPWTDVMMMADASGEGLLTLDEVEGFHANAHFVGFMPFVVDHFNDCDADEDQMLSMFELKKCTKEMGMTDAETSTVFYKGLGFMPKAKQ